MIKSFKIYAKYFYAISATALAIIIDNASNSEIWKHEPMLELLGISIPVCAGCGLLLERSSTIKLNFSLKFSMFLALLCGLAGLTLFMFAVNTNLGQAFLVGIFAFFYHLLYSIWHPDQNE